MDGYNGDCIQFTIRYFQPYSNGTFYTVFADYFLYRKAS